MPIASIFAFLQPLLANTPLWVLFVMPGLVAPILALMIASFFKGIGARQSGKTIFELATIVVSGVMLNVVAVGFQDVLESRGFMGMHLLGVWVSCFATNAILLLLMTKVIDGLPMVLQKR